MLNLSNCHRNSNLDSKKLVFYFFYLLDCACVLSHFSHVCLCDPMDPRLLCLSVKVEIWVNVEKFFKNIRWNETMCKIVHKIWASFFFLSFFFFFTNKHNFSNSAREKWTGMGPVSRGEDSYPSTWIFTIYSYWFYNTCVGGKGTYKHSNVKKKKRRIL